MLDYDGTLAPFRVERNQAIPYPGVREAVAAIIRTGSRVAIVSGRPSAEVIPLLGIKPHPEVWGGHGFERARRGGEVERFPLPEGQAESLDRALSELGNAGLGPRLEAKYGSLAVHWRGDEQEEVARIRSLVLPVLECGADAGLARREFDSGLELRATGRDKGTTVRQLLAEAGEDVVCAYLGDDITDEDAFLALGESGLGVLVRPEPRPSAAAVWIKPPDELLEFLSRWARACRGDPR